MATVTGFTAARMQVIEDGTVVDGEVDGSGHLILTKHDGSTIDAGPVMGPTGPMGPAAVQGIPGEIKMWSGETLPDSGDYGVWTWANGDVFDEVDYPIAAVNISGVWKTAHGMADPGTGKFRVPDLRGLVPAALDALPVGSARVARTTRAVAIVLAAKTGEETHVITVPELAQHRHFIADHWHYLNPHTHPFQHGKSGAAVGSGFTALKESVSGSLANYDTDGQVATAATKSVSETFGTADIPGQYIGGNVAHENMQPTVFVPYIVKLDD
jgi:microcystin-dependent protein